ncbi:MULTISPECIES: CDP-diacylglycerol--glycerol-3-phosphate 3-phosphatidyltransferase [Marinobacter]|jgi:CDP-diacylglycerol--glycerol-3-phosphate 3-phosphatidyltransferase|uniref:CDP-diacylglycerol--glycerol-3-phosphate 3-phosphatidyltransferase n=1 Tax=Marinobacter TaxID=2742 RepID=UPI000277677B|nr:MULTISPECIES: CDP-diacylglycerol--glycerol-3-phosphate 3-phosphatidyltransferase [Marinobacter]AFP30746.1 CDP-diacylglycerol--glycerol-3-phosphate 3-phosphatidyltransferase [Marinobacter sp. BSs20148]MBQ0762031.1 CDP-diacylglycerol--glycerol-3-phosphate 3-phosphatidyltransferase [Marinobacter psychrophilus]MBQ0844036.1 CDP-diacylglycerol--glycerol-3-phosphate 3-phosphatidyltransferase [Marinobacter psychrophilus]
MNIPNILTLSRIVMIPVFVFIFYMPVQWSYLVSATIFTLAAVTDWLDGYLARKLNQSTPFGAFLDPVADKLMVAVALAVLIEEHAALILTLPATVIIGREIVISALREWMAEIGSRASVAVSYIGKIKTVAQMAAIIGLLAFPPGVVQADIAIALLYLAAGLTLWSMGLYLQAAWPDLFPRK